ncbi:MAG: hypothetical protein KGL39_43205 [Patescibacteria group bacterium]|nr:hypothetical protein [Patescibacteria group bacterium]
MVQVLQYLFDRLKAERPVTQKVGEQEYAVRSDGTLGEPVRDLAPQFVKPVFRVGTLSGLAELVKVKLDEFPSEVALHVVDHLTVQLVSTRADEFGRRHVFAEAKHVEGTPFKFNQFIEAEDFLISFRRCFLFNEDAVKVQTVCSKLESGVTVKLADDGVSQALELKAGTVSGAQITIPAEGISLIPWRTFRDAAPADSKFLLRFKTVKDSLPMIALYEIDQKWQLDTIQSIASWLVNHTKDVPVVA